jgi:hypothetical protein
MIRRVLESLQDQYLTWHTGRAREDREFRQWADCTVVQNATTIENMFQNFRHIVPVSTRVFDLDEPFGWIPCPEFREFLYPTRPLGHNAVWYFARGFRDAWDGRFHISDLRAEQDQVFVATNSDQDAVIIALRWS